MAIGKISERKLVNGLLRVLLKKQKPIFVKKINIVPFATELVQVCSYSYRD